MNDRQKAGPRSAAPEGAFGGPVAPAGPSPATALPGPDSRDLGFGSVVARESQARLLNRDGSFNVAREGLHFVESVNPYHALLTMSWWRYLGLVALLYLAENALFAAAYALCGPDALEGAHDDLGSPFVRAFFFSVQTFATIGYGRVSPVGLAANILVTVESIVGLLSFALATGLMFARFSRPTAKIVFSKAAVVAPYGSIAAFQFRVANAQKNQIIELEAKVVLSRLEHVGGVRIRQFYNLRLERGRVAFFPLSWTVVHPIDSESPLFGTTERDLLDAEAEFLVLLTGIDETFSQAVHARSSYRATEVVWNARFTSIFRERRAGEHITIDVSRIDAIDRIEARAGVEV